MRHFAHHIGDYAAATAHLSMLEDAAYHRLLRLYYQHEAPLTTDENELMRRVRANSRHEKTAVRSVLKEFFTLESDGWHQSRADKEISNYKHLVEAGREGGIKSGVARSLKQNRTNQEPLTKNQEPLTKEDKIPRQARKTKLPDDWQASEDQLAYAAKQGCVDPEDTAEGFRLHHTAKGTMHVNWAAAWQYWCRNEKNFRRSTQTAQFARDVASVTRPDDEAQWSARLRNYRPGGVWSPMWGERPEDIPEGRTPTHIPPPVLAAWRASA